MFLQANTEGHASALDSNRHGVCCVAECAALTEDRYDVNSTCCPVSCHEACEVWITVSHHSHALFMEPQALAYHKMGDLDKAQKEYEKIISLSRGRLFFGDIYVKSFYMLGKIYEEQGDHAKVIENYNKFLTLWQDADPGLPEVEDARERVAALQNK